MDNPIEMEQKGSLGSTNTQIAQLNVGIDYAGARQIAQDVFDSNITKYTHEALTKVNERINHFNDRLNDFLINNNLPIDEFKKPGFQSFLFKVQKIFTINEDDDLEALLLDMIGERLKEPNKNLKQISIEESISILDKLTNGQLNTLSLIFFLTYTKRSRMPNLDSFRDLCKNSIKPLTKGVSNNEVNFQHLEYLGCGKIEFSEYNIEKIFLDNYTGMFFTGFDNNYLKNHIGNFDYGNLFIPCLNNLNKLQPNAVNMDDWKKTISESNINDSNVRSKLINLFNNFRFTLPEIKSKIIEYGGNELEALFYSNIKSFSITNVGVILAELNLRKQIGVSVNLDFYFGIKCPRTEQ